MKNLNQWTILFLVLAIASALLAFVGVLAHSVGIVRIAFLAFLVMAVISYLTSLYKPTKKVTK